MELGVNFDKLERKIKNILFYNCKRKIKSELATIESKQTIYTNNLIYKKQKLVTESKKFLGKIKDKSYQIKILLIIKVSYIYLSL